MNKILLISMIAMIALVIPIEIEGATIIKGLRGGAGNFSDMKIQGDAGADVNQVGANIVIGRSHTGARRNRGLVNWSDEMIRDNIPSGSTVNWCRFDVNVGGVSGTALQLDIHPINKSWEELVVTWNNFGGGSGGVNMSEFNSSWELADSPTSITSTGKINITINTTYCQNIVDDTLGDFDKGWFIRNIPGEDSSGSDQNFDFTQLEGASANLIPIFYFNFTEAVANTPPSAPTIIFPTANLITNLQPLNIDVTFPEDIDGDNITINYYIDGKLNQSSLTNVTFNASDATYILNVSLFDGTASSANTSVTFTIDTTNPTFAETSINESAPLLNEVVGLSQVVNDNIGLNQYSFFHNQTGTFVNQTPIDISGTSVNATFNLTVTLTRGNVIGFGFFANDSAGNSNITTISTFTVANTPPSAPTIIFPTANLRTNVQPLDINITFPADADGDTLTINFYINGTLNQSSTTNTTLNASSNIYFLEVSVDDGFSSSANVSVSFEIDTTNPIITINSPADASTHSVDISVNITCSDLNILDMNYSFFNASGQLQSQFENVSVGNLLTIEDTLLIANFSDGAYTLNVTCSDRHTKTEIPDYNPNKDLGNLELTYNTPESNDDIAIKLKSTTATLDDFGTFKDTDRYVFWFNFVEPETATVYEYVFKINNKEKLTYLPDSDFKGHFVTSQNWIDFEFDGNEDATYTIKQTNDDKYEVKIKTTKTSLNFNSIGSLNIVTESISLTIDTSIPAPAITGAVAVLPLENAGSIVGMIALLFIILGLLGFRSFQKNK